MRWGVPVPAIKLYCFFSGNGRKIMEQNWREIKRKLQSSLSRGQYNLWVSSIEFLGLENETLALGCKNRFHIEWLREKLEVRLLADCAGVFSAGAPTGVSDSQWGTRPGGSGRL